MTRFASFKVRNDISVSTMSKICKEIRDKFPDLDIWVEVRGVNDVYIEVDGPGGICEVMHSQFQTDTQRYLKIVEDEVRS